MFWDFFGPRIFVKKKNTPRKSPEEKSLRNETKPEFWEMGTLKPFKAIRVCETCGFFLLFFRCICCGTLLLELTSHQTGSLENHRLNNWLLSLELIIQVIFHDRDLFLSPNVGLVTKKLWKGHCFHHPKKVTFSQNCQGLWFSVKRDDVSSRIWANWWPKKIPEPEYP